MNNELISGMTEIFSTECMQQKVLLGEVFSAYSVDPEIRAELERAKKAIRARLPLVWLGMGASYCSSISGANRYSLAGRPSFPVEASEWLHYAVSTWNDVAGPVLITTSGESAELVELCSRRQNFTPSRPPYRRRFNARGDYSGRRRSGGLGPSASRGLRRQGWQGSAGCGPRPGTTR